MIIEKDLKLYLIFKHTLNKDLHTTGTTSHLNQTLRLTWAYLNIIWTNNIMNREINIEN